MKMTVLPCDTCGKASYIIKEYVNVFFCFALLQNVTETPDCCLPGNRECMILNIPDIYPIGSLRVANLGHQFHADEPKWHKT